MLLFMVVVSTVVDIVNGGWWSMMADGNGDNGAVTIEKLMVVSGLCSG